ncbi:hypothetical protein [Mycobacteroides abscessus]|uniref:hypothetical protein n=1 Tax=Mycobacteroides abscessus TaxID=36809 RepID=UPI0015E84EF7|nr:hypothetical protein [Mycobacteroides abscessus]
MSEEVTQPDEAHLHTVKVSGQDDEKGRNTVPTLGEPSEAEQKLADAEKRIAELADAADRADKYARALFEARVAATGRLADPTDMPFTAELVDDTEALTAAIDALLAAKPHLASRKPVWGDVGAGQTKSSDSGPSFADLFRGG